MEDKLYTNSESKLFDEPDAELKEHIRKLIKEVIVEEFKNIKYIPIPYPAYQPITFQPLSIGDNPAYDPQITCEHNHKPLNI